METVLEQRNKTIFNQQDQFLKVVESVLTNKQFIYKGKVAYLATNEVEHLLQEIKKCY